MQPDPSGAPTGDAASFLAGLSTLDRVGLGLLAVFLVLGALRGLWWQVIRFVGLLGAAVLARCVAPRWSPTFSDTSGLPPVVAQGLVWFSLFVFGLLAASLLGLVGKKSLDAMQLGAVDRFGGALAGAITGLLLHAALLLGLSYLGPQPWTAEQLRGSRSQTLLRLVSTRLPVLLDRDSVAAREIRGWLGTGIEDGEQLAGPAELEGTGGASLEAGAVLAAPPRSEQPSESGAEPPVRESTPRGEH